MKKKEKNKSSKKMTANEYINVADIKDNFLYTKDGQIISFIKLSTISISTMSKTDIKILLNTLCSEFASITTNIRFFKISKRVDISRIVNDYKEMYRSSNDLKQKEFLKEATYFLHKHSTAGSELENQYYMILKEKVKNSMDLEKRAREVANKFQRAKIETEICTNQDIARLCNLFANPIFTNESIDIENRSFAEDISIIEDFIGE